MFYYDICCASSPGNYNRRRAAATEYHLRGLCSGKRLHLLAKFMYQSRLVFALLIALAISLMEEASFDLTAINSPPNVVVILR